MLFRDLMGGESWTLIYTEASPQTNESYTDDDTGMYYTGGGSPRPISYKIDLVIQATSEVIDSRTLYDTESRKYVLCPG